MPLPTGLLTEVIPYMIVVFLLAILCLLQTWEAHKRGALSQRAYYATTALGVPSLLSQLYLLSLMDPTPQAGAVLWLLLASAYVGFWLILLLSQRGLPRAAAAAFILSGEVAVPLSLIGFLPAGINTLLNPLSGA